MERASAFSLKQDRGATPGHEMGAREMKQAVDQFLQNPIALSILGGLGAEQQGRTEGLDQLPAPQALAFAMGVVASILLQQNQRERSGAETAYNPSVLDALAQVGLSRPTGRTWVETNAVVSGRPFDQIAREWAKPPEILLVEKKVEQYKGLAAAGRFDVLDPQFGADAAFLPYTGLWDKVGPGIQAQLTSMQEQWAELAQYWGAVIAGGRPAGPPPPDSWGVGEIAMEKLEAATAADLTQMKTELESGTATKESMAAHLERLDQRKEMLGSDKLEVLIAAVFGEKAEEVQDWLDFRAEFVSGKADYWHQVAEVGQEEAHAWDQAVYQPLREKRDQGLQGEYAALVGAIQAKAEALHHAYQGLYDAKVGWWQAYREGQPTREWEQMAKDVRERLAECDPQGAHWWGPGRDWAIDRDQRSLVGRFEQAHTAYWESLVNADAAGLAAAKAQLQRLKVYHISSNAEPIRRITEAYKPQVEAAYLKERALVSGVRSPTLLNYHLGRIGVLEREMGDDWVKRLEGRGSDRAEARAPERSEGLVWRMPLQDAILTTPYSQQDKLHTYGHGGIDLISRTSSDVMATARGEVVFAGRDPQTPTDTSETGLGYMAIVDHGNGYFSVYGHMEKDSVKVKVGDTVEAGQALGLMGNTGYSDGAHLHLELRQGIWDPNQEWYTSLTDRENPWLLLETRGFGINFRRLLEDEQFLDTSMKLEDVRSVLRQSPTFGQYVDKGDFPVYREIGGGEVIGHVDVAKLLHESARQEGINPMLLLARMETEQSVLTEEYPPNSKQVFKVLGYGATDGGDLSEHFGIDIQISNAANGLKLLFDAAPAELSDGPVLFGGLNDTRDSGRTTSAVLSDQDGAWGPVIITEHVGVENRATWALYRYTPHLVDLNLLPDKDRLPEEDFPDKYETEAYIHGGNKRFLESWNMVEAWVADSKRSNAGRPE